MFGRRPDPDGAAPGGAGGRVDPEALLRRVEWTVRRRLDGLLYGDYRTFFRGVGLDLADLREYQLHDDVRHIDWNVTARLQAPFVREFHEDREITAWFLLDLSPSVDFGSGERRKDEILAEFVALLSRILTRSGNRVGAILHRGGGESVLPPRGSRTQVLQLLDRILREPDPAERGSPSRPPGTTDLGAFLARAAPVLRRRSFVFVVSDFVSVPGWGKPLLNLARRHEVLAIRLFDPLELALPDLGLVVMEDAETGEQLLVDTQDEGFRLRFQAAARKREGELRQALSRAGVDALELSTDGDAVEAILRFADLRKTRSRLMARGGLPSHLETGS